MLQCAPMKNDRIVIATGLEQETGLGGDLLRKWRSRYGFPVPVYARGQGGWLYSELQITQLKLIRRLLDGGFRPGQIVGAPIERLEALLDELPCGNSAGAERPVVEEVIELLGRNAVAELNDLFDRERSKCSAREFVIDLLAPLTTAVGDAWAAGRLAIYQEHLCSSLLMARLNVELRVLRPRPTYPRIIFATPCEETHALGLLMARVVLADCGAECIDLGAQVPAAELAQAANACRADIVALSFSFAYPRRKVRPELLRLRQLLPDSVAIWAGGMGAEAIRRPPPGVQLFSDLGQAAGVLHELAGARA